jgi:hypothetical protein
VAVPGVVPAASGTATPSGPQAAATTETVVSSVTSADATGDVRSLADSGPPSAPADLTAQQAQMIRSSDGGGTLRLTATLAAVPPQPVLLGTIDTTGDGNPEVVLDAGGSETVTTRTANGSVSCRLPAPTISGTTLGLRLPVGCGAATTQPVAVRLAVLDDRTGSAGTGPVGIDPAPAAATQRGLRVLAPALVVPALSSPADGRLRIFTPTATGVRMDAWTSGVGWATPRTLALPTAGPTGGIGAAPDGRGGTVLATVNAAGAVTLATVDSAGHLGPLRPIGGVVDAVAVAVAGTTTVVAARSSNGSLYWQRIVAGQTGTWVGLGGQLNGPPAVAYDSTHALIVVADPNGRLWTRTCSTVCLTATPLDSWVFGPPSLTSRGSTLTLAVRGIRGTLYARDRVNGSWAGWASVGDLATSRPAVAASGPGTVHLAVRDNRILYTVRRTNGQWTPPAPTPVQLTPA